MQRKRTLHIHAGYHKTGTSVIQNYLFHADLGDLHRYLHAGIPNSSLLMLQAFKRDYGDTPQYSGPKLSIQEAREIQKNARGRINTIIEQINCPNMILSAESISTFRQEEHEDLRDFFAQYFSELKIYIYLRPHKSRIESAFQEILKTRYRGLEQQFILIFEKAIAKIDAVYGRDQLNISKYCRSNFTDSDVVSHFLEQLGLTRTEHFSEGENVSLSLPAIQLLYIYRKHFPGTDKNDSNRVKKLSKLTGRPFHLHSDLFQRLLLTKEGDLEWLKRRTGISLHEDIEEHDSYSIRNEADLINISNETLGWLKRQQRGWFRPTKSLGNSTSSIAKGVRSLRA